jgi:hypothetical protein
MTPRAPASEREAALREALEDAARDAHALTDRDVKYPSCSGPFETCPSLYCSKYRAALAAHPTPPPPLDAHTGEAFALDVERSVIPHSLVEQIIDATIGLRPATTPSPDAGELERLRRIEISTSDGRFNAAAQAIHNRLGHGQLPECSGTHLMGYALCQSLAADALRAVRAALEGAKP